MSQPRDLAEGIASFGRRPGVIRLGTVTAVGARSDGGPSYTVVTINGREMRCLSSYPFPAPGDVVVWLRDGQHAICLGTRL